MGSSIYKYIISNKKRGKKLFAVLVDPDKFSPEVIHVAHKTKVDCIFIGGSKIKNGSFHPCADAIRKLTNLPLVIFPGSREQVSKRADAILLLSLISGRNPDYLIGEHIKAAHELKKSGLEIIPTGYILIEGGKKISTQLVTRTSPIKKNDNALAVSTAIAGELLGMKMIYLEAGSGAKIPLDINLLKEVRKNIQIPILAGGGINSVEKSVNICRAGADMIIIGNAIEKDISLIPKITKAIHAIK